MIKAIIFDCFGVFYIDPFRHFMKVHADVYDALHETLVAYDLGKVSKEELIGSFASLSKLQQSEVADLLYGVAMVRDHDVLAYSQHLRHTYMLGMLSNLGKGAMDKFFTQAERKKYFDDVVVSGDVGLVKPWPEIFTLAASRLGVEPHEVVFIDDVTTNCEGARSVGMQAVAYTGLPQLQRDMQKILGA